MKHLILATMILTACGTESDKSSSPEASSPDVVLDQDREDVPTFRGYISVQGYLSCHPFINEFESDCRAQWTQGDRNCGNATVVFVRTEDGYVYVQTLRDQIIRQGQPHDLIFVGTPDVYNVKNENRLDKLEAFYYCKGPNE